MARADLIKKLFQSYQGRDDISFRAAAEEIIQEERKKHHPVLANELDRILKNGKFPKNNTTELTSFAPPPQNADKKTFLFDIKHTNRYFNDVVLSNNVQKSIKRVVHEFRGWEILKANELQPVQRVLFCGPSGCGKTVTAEAIAAELGLPLLYVRFDAVVSSLLGETAANLRKVFDYASRGQWVMLFDEFDAIGRSRDDVTEHGEIKRVVNSFLQIMDNFDGRSLVIAATNFEQALDPAVWRRFDDVIRFEKPTPEQLQCLIQKLLSHLNVHKKYLGVIIKELSDTTFAEAERMCFDIRKLCALRGNCKVEKEDVTDSIERHNYRVSIMKKASSINEVPIIDKD